LKKDKIIRGFHADIDATKITPFISVMTMLMLEKQNQAEYQKMNDIIQDIPQIVRAHRTTGEFDYILETHAQDFNSFRNIIEDLVNRDVVVKQYHSRIMQEQVKFRGNIDFPEDR
ncbi:MAG: Lrp/AsnC family transcriptional regulator, partial [Pseudomonadota bacterium]